MLPTFAQGIVLGKFIQGFAVRGREFVGGSFDCFTPFSLLTGVALMFGYGLLVGTVFLPRAVPLYTAWSYWVFRGKVRADIGYH